MALKSSKLPEHEPIEFAGCAMRECHRKARVKILRNKIWLNLCLECHAQLTLAESREYCRKLGLHTRDDCYHWIRQRIPRIGRSPQTIDDREPGADESEVIDEIPLRVVVESN